MSRINKTSHVNLTFVCLQSIHDKKCFKIKRMGWYYKLPYRRSNLPCEKMRLPLEPLTLSTDQNIANYNSIHSLQHPIYELYLDIQLFFLSLFSKPYWRFKIKELMICQQKWFKQLKVCIRCNLTSTNELFRTLTYVHNSMKYFVFSGYLISWVFKMSVHTPLEAPQWY